MKLGIMQPYFFPYIGYFDLINRTDRWVVFDTVKYNPKSWMNRNRILHPISGWQYISVPVDKRSNGRTIKDVHILDKSLAQRRILGQIEHYRKGRAPFFAAARDLIERTFRETTSDRLCELNVNSLDLVCAYLGIAFPRTCLSDMGLALPAIRQPGEWALEISAAMRATEYINAPGGRDLFVPAAFEQRGIHLSVAELIDFRYPTNGYAFVAHLSVLDAIMWNPPASIKAYLDDCAAHPVSCSALAGQSKSADHRELTAPQ
jgi:hypothetical protein